MWLDAFSTTFIVFVFKAKGAKLNHTVLIHLFQKHVAYWIRKKMVLQGMSERTIKIGRFYGKEINVEKSKVMRISRQRSPIQIIRDQRQPENVEYFNCLISIITNDATCAREINPGLP